MKIIISQQDKKLSIEFCQGKFAAPQLRGEPRPEKSGRVDKFVIDKADEFLMCVDKFFKKRDNAIKAISKARLEFVNVGVLTERIIRAIIAGLRLQN